MSRDFDWETLRRDVAEVQRPLTDDPELLRRERARLLLVSGGPARRSGSRFHPHFRAGLWAIAAAAVVAVGAFWLWPRPELVLSFRAGGAAAPTPVGTWLSPVGTHELAVSFSDGTLMALQPATRARVLRVTARDADIALEQGALKVSVVHHEGAEWHVGAGPFRVVVTGTQFDVSWSAADATFNLLLREGRVRVEGPTLPAGGQWVRVGQPLHVALAERQATSSSSAPPPTAAIEMPAAPVVSAPMAKAGAAPPIAAWKDLVKSQRYREALAAVELSGFDATCRAASPGDLVLLGNAARFAGSADRADQAFRLVRSRFPGSAEASMAAFFLGRIAYDQRGDRQQAALWFQSYLHEAPGGALAREAAGRLLEAERALGDREAARAAARAYLQKYPSGPHAGLAREVLTP